MKRLQSIVTLAGVMLATASAPAQVPGEESADTAQDAAITIVGKLLDRQGEPLKEGVYVTMTAVVPTGESGEPWSEFHVFFRFGDPKAKTDSTGSFALETDIAWLPEIFAVQTAAAGGLPSSTAMTFRQGRVTLYVVADAPGVREVGKFTIVSVVPEQDGKKIDLGELTWGW